MNVLVIAPHPDDEAIGCGGSIAKHVTQGDRVRVVFLTNGERGMEGWMPQSSDAERADYRGMEARASANLLGFAPFFMHWPDGQVSFDLLSKMGMEQHDAFLEPLWDRVYAPHLGEAHADHIAAATIATELFSPTKVWLYECWTPLARPDPVKLTDITPWLGHKYGAIRCYKSQEHNSFCSAILALNHYRGLLLGPNKMYCEAFG